MARQRAERKPVPPAPGSFKVRRQHHGLRLCPPGGTRRGSRSAPRGSGEAAEAAPLRGEGAEAELPPGAQSLYKQRGQSIEGWGE